MYPVRLTLAAWAALSAMVVTALRDSTRVTSRVEMQDVRFGWPWPWLTQDHSRLDPPLPSTQTPLSPWEFPTGPALLPAVATLIVFTTAFYLLLLSISAAFGRRHRLLRRMRGQRNHPVSAATQGSAGVPDRR